MNPKQTNVPVSPLSCNNQAERKGNAMSVCDNSDYKPLLLSQSKIPLRAAAKRIGIGETTMRRIVREGQIPCIKIGAKQLFLERDLDNFLLARYGRMEQPANPSFQDTLDVPESVCHSPHLKPRRAA